MKEISAPSITVAGTPEIPELLVHNQAATARISLLGGHIMEFAPNDAKPVLWMSDHSWHEIGKPLRGGIPVCFPWFGKNGEKPSHGYARLALWEVVSALDVKQDLTQVELKLSDRQIPIFLEPFEFDLRIRFSIGKTLETTLSVENLSRKTQKIGMALHTYFSVSDVKNVKVTGLDGEKELDTLTNTISPRQGDIRFDREFDRVYLHSTCPVELVDSGWNRTIRVEKKGSLSTVVWNPWIEKSHAMPDFGDEEYHHMTCVESANCRGDECELEPGESHAMTQIVSLL